ncbi:MAG: sigma-70 family RNA polymerase sigma factor [Herpetosiphonaceae bacterium]|nr:sigma-70 family RNA polymerase sigma factor [Herpetosiphonaceae bacterium]
MPVESMRSLCYDVSALWECPLLAKIVRISPHYPSIRYAFVVLMEHNSSELEIQCRQAVEQFVTRHAWALLDHELFVQQTLAQILQDVDAKPPRAALYVYSQAMYNACSGSEGQDRQELGYTELHRYLCDIAYWRYRDVSTEAAQQALEATFIAFQRCRTPGAFLAFALQHLRDAAKALRRQLSRPEASFEAASHPDDVPLLERLVDEAQLDPADEALLRMRGQERVAGVERCLEEFRQLHPRAHQQLEVLLLQYRHGLDDRTIGQRLGNSVENVYVLRTRAIAKLKQLACWQELAREDGLLPHVKHETRDRRPVEGGE